MQWLTLGVTSKNGQRVDFHHTHLSVALWPTNARYALSQNSDTAADVRRLHLVVKL